MTKDEPREKDTVGGGGGRCGRGRFCRNQPDDDDNDDDRRRYAAAVAEGKCREHDDRYNNNDHMKGMEASRNTISFCQSYIMTKKSSHCDDSFYLFDATKKRRR